MVPFFFCKFSASLSSWFLFLKMQRRKLAEKNQATEFLKLIFVICYFEKLIWRIWTVEYLWSRNVEWGIWKSDFWKLMIRKLWYLFSQVFFVGFFSAFFSSIFYFKNGEESWRRNHKRKSAPEKYKATTLLPVPVCSGSFYVSFWLIEKKYHILNSGTSLWKWEPYVEKRNHFYMWNCRTIYWKQVPSVEKRNHFSKTGTIKGTENILKRFCKEFRCRKWFPFSTYWCDEWLEIFSALILWFTFSHGYIFVVLLFMTQK